MRAYLSVFLLALLVSSALATRLAALGGRLRLVDRETGVVRSGGLSIVAAAAVAVAVLGLFFDPTRSLLATAPPELGAALAGGAAILALGIVDDRWGLTASPKLLVEVTVAVALWLGGSRIGRLWLPFGIAELHPVMSLLLTVGWVVFLTNAFNLLDGIDGAAAGAALFALLALFVASVTLGSPLIALLAAALAGATLGFLPFNFPPARVYLGDAGSLVLGYALAVFAVEGATKGPTIVAIAIPLVAFGLPVMDTTVAVVRRLARGAPLFQGDRGHLHHRLLDLGISRTQATVILYAVSAAFALGSMLLLNANVRGLAVILTMVGLAFWAAIRYLRLHEFHELGRLAARGVRQRRAISFNVALRQAAESLGRCDSWDAIMAALARLFTASEFDGVRLTARSVSGSRAHQDFRLENGAFVPGGVPIHADEWGLHVPFPIGSDGGVRGELAVFRRFGRKPLLTDVNLLVEVLRPALAQAAGRIAPPPLG